jgi:hypothetical protein
MRKSAFVFLLLLLASPLLRAQQAKSCTVDAGDKEKAVAAVRNMYAALTRGDQPGTQAFFTTDNGFFDLGKEYTADAIINEIRDLQSKGNTFAWTVNNPTVILDCHSAFIEYTNVGSLTTGGKVIPLKWLESVYLIKDQGAWKIRFFHSTQAAEEKQ